MRIGELAALAGVSVRSLRYYEEQGLLTSARTSGGQRWYTEVEVERVTLIRRLYAAGLSSSTIATLMPCVDTPSEATSESAMARMAEERARLSTHIAELVRTRDSLDDLMRIAREHRQALRAAAGQEPPEGRLRGGAGPGSPLPQVPAVDLGAAVG